MATRNEIPADMWLHVAADALARYVAAGGAVEVQDTAAIGAAVVTIVLPIGANDPRLPASIVALRKAPTPAEQTTANAY